MTFVKEDLEVVLNFKKIKIHGYISISKTR